MEVVTFDVVKDDIVGHLKAKRILPIIGSGMTSKSMSRKGHVPSGTEMKEYMIDVIKKKLDSVYQELSEKSFSKIATYYNEVEDTIKQKSYIRDNFTGVELSDVKKKFLSIDWLYVYTLNFDDGIENNSNYKYVITSNRDVDFKNLSTEKLVIKLHGDVHEYIKYTDYDGKIFDYDQYAKSIQKNQSLLNKLSHDFTFNNSIFVGCSLDDEMDLKSITSFTANNQENKSAKYYLTVKEPDVLKKIELKNYGITHIVLNEDYDSIYSNVYDAYKESLLTSIDELSQYKNIPMKYIDRTFSDNKDYLYFSKSIFKNKEGRFLLPAFFIDRDLTTKIVSNLYKSSIHLIYGSRVSGKTYLLASLACKIRDRDFYYFNSENGLNKDTIEKVLSEKNTVICFDTKSIDKDSMFKILRNADAVENNKNIIILAINTSDKDIVSAINTSKSFNKVACYELNSKLSKLECNDINKKLSFLELPKFSYKNSIIDNLVSMQNENEKRGTFVRLKFQMDTVEQIALLILYAVNEKIYTTDLINYNVVSENYIQIRKTEPLITKEHTLFYERDVLNTSSDKYVLHAKFWLYECLGHYAKTKSSREVIVNAYKYIIKHLLKQNNGNPFSISMDFIKFDVINEIFKSDYKGQLGLAKEIYEGLNEQLSSSAHYYHQRAKCYLWQSNHDTKSISDLKEALRFANLAKQYLNVELAKYHNEKIEISLGHVEVTIAYIYAKLYHIANSQDDILLNQAVESIYYAIVRKSNHRNFILMEKKRHKNDINKLIVEIPSLESRLLKENKKRFAEIFEIFRSFQTT